MNIMNFKLDTEKIAEFVRPKLKYLPAVGIFVVIVVYVFLTFLALYPREDKALLTQGEAEVQELDIRFNTKLLKELETTKTPAQLGTAGGRDPFSSF